MDKFISLIIKYSYSSCWNDNIKNKEEGGPHCAKENNFYFKLFSNLLIILINIFIIYKFSKNTKEKKFENKNLGKKHKKIKKILGSISLLILLLQSILKLTSKTFVFILNPCHLSCVVSIILFFSENKKPRIFNFLLTLLFGCTLGLLFPAFGFVYFPFKKEIFYIEHLVPFVTSGYLYFTEYNDIDFLSFKKHFEGFFYFSFYQRTILWGISELTWVNLNFTLCGNSVDPFYKNFGPFYLVLAEIYLSFGSFITKSIFIGFLSCVLKLKNYVLNYRKINDFKKGKNNKIL